MPIVKVGDQRIKFPDSMSQEEIGAVLARQFGEPPPESMQTRRGLRASGQPEAARDPFEGLPEEIVADIEARFPLPEGRVRGAGVGAKRQRQQAAELEQIRLINPFLASQIEETGGMEAFLVASGRGLTTVGRGLGLAEQEDPIVTTAVEGLRTQQPAAFSTGEVLGETAPFAAIGGPLIGAARTGLQRAALGGALSGAEGGVLALGQGATPQEAATTAAITAPLGVFGALVPSSRRLAGRQTDDVMRQELLKEPSKKEIAREIVDAAPTIDQLKSASRDVYKEIDDLGVSIKPQALTKVTSSIRQNLEDSGLDAINTPKAFRAVRRLEELLGETPTLRQIDQIRETAQAAAGDTLNKKEAALGAKFINSIDEFLDDLQPGQFTGDAKDLGVKYKQARDLWGRARRSEMIENAFIDAEDQASGFENGIRIAFRKILRNKKQSRFFSKDEIAEMRKVVRGTPGANLTKFVGKLGVTEGQATNFLGASVGAFGGATIFGGPGAVIVPAVGQVSKKFAQRLTKGNADFANAVIRSGKDGKKIVAAYMRNTPKPQRDPQELAQLLMRPKVNLDNVVDMPLVREARTLAEQLRQQAAAVAPLAAVPAIAEEE